MMILSMRCDLSAFAAKTTVTSSNFKPPSLKIKSENDTLVVAVCLQIEVSPFIKSRMFISNLLIELHH